VKKSVLFALPLAATLLAGTPAFGADSQLARPEASIPFANRGGVEDWRAQGDTVIWFQDQHRRWYRAELFGPAFDLPSVEHIGIDASHSGTLDKFGAIVVRGHRYGFRSFERMDGPPPRYRARKS
jgi:hypothetical protein